MSTSLQSNSYSSESARISIRLRLVMWNLLALALSVMICGVGYAEVVPAPEDPMLLEEAADFSGRVFFVRPQQSEQRGPTLEVLDSKTAAARFIQSEGYRFGVYSLSQLAEEPVIREEFDGSSSVYFGQRHLGVPVVGGEIKVRVVDGVGISAVGKIANSLPVNVSPQFSAEAALDKAVLSWQTDNGTMEVPGASVPSLEVLAIGILENTPNIDAPLVWAIKISDEPSNTDLTYYVGAVDGEVKRVEDNVRHGTYPINRRIYNCSMSSTFNCDYLTHGRAEGGPIRGPNTVPGFAFGKFDVDLSYDNSRHSHDYWGMTFNMNGANGYGGLGNNALTRTRTTVRTFVDLSWPSGCPGRANFIGSSGTINLCLDVTQDDEIGHEYAHAVQYSSVLNGGQPSGFVNSGQSGAISEGWADLFGAAVQDSVSEADWTIFNRNISDPPSVIDQRGNINLPHPDFTYHSGYYCGADQDSGIHHNSTVVSNAASNMVMGGDLNGCFLHPISFEQVQRIYFQALTHYLTRTASYVELYFGVLQACQDLYPTDVGPAGQLVCSTVRGALEAAMLDQAGKCATPAVPERAPYCTRPVYNVYATNSAGIKQGVFYSPWEIRLRGDGIENSTVNVYLMNSDPSRGEDAPLAPLHGDARFLLDGASHNLKVPNTKPYDWEEQFNWHLWTADQPGAGIYDIIVDNRDGKFNATNDSFITIEVRPPLPPKPCGSIAKLSQNCVAKPIGHNVTPVMN